MSAGRQAAQWCAGLLAAAAIAGGLTAGSAATVAPLDVGVAAAELREPLPPLQVAPDGPGGRASGYSRDQFGDDWAPALGPGCDVRDAVLARDLTDTTARRGCDVTAGTLHDPYTGAVVTGPTRNLDIDHVVPLSLAWQTGAAGWTPEERERFANDPANLRATVAAGPGGNRAKGDDGPEKWLPTVDRCGYVTAFATQAARYGLTVTANRQAAIERACA